MRHRIGATAAVALAAACGVAGAPRPIDLPAGQATALRVEALQALLDSAATTHEPPGGRVWMEFLPRSGIVVVPREVTDPLEGSSPEERARAIDEWIERHHPSAPPPDRRDSLALREAFPELRFVDRGFDMFRCPEGTRVRLPGFGCPIADGGIIVQLGHPRVDADSAWVGAALVQSQGALPARVTSWAAGWEVVFGRVDGGWTLRRVRSTGGT